MKTLIIEDEKAAVRNLTALLAGVTPEAEIIAAVDSVSEAIDWFASHDMPELIFMDIHLADGSAFEIFDHVEITCPIIFTTAYDEYAVRAFKVNSIDYLLKPIGEEDIIQAMNKLRKLHEDGHPDEESFRQLIRSLKREGCYKTHFLVPVKGDKLLPLSVDMIAYFYINEGIVKVATLTGKEYALSQTLDELTECLNPTLFFRANRQFLISRESIKDIDLWFNNRLAINLKAVTLEKILVSKARVNDFKDWFSGEIYK
ncbi:MAG: LytTR family DNA-binding domain-containing protein [Bacteroides sp.]